MRVSPYSAAGWFVGGANMAHTMKPGSSKWVPLPEHITLPVQANPTIRMNSKISSDEG